MITALLTPLQTTPTESLNVVHDLEQFVAALDERLRFQLTPDQYRMVRDLQVATRVIAVARESSETCACAA